VGEELWRKERGIIEEGKGQQRSGRVEGKRRKSSKLTLVALSFFLSMLIFMPERNPSISVFSNGSLNRFMPMPPLSRHSSQHFTSVYARWETRRAEPSVSLSERSERSSCMALVGRRKDRDRSWTGC